jgi:hypothetical protein
MNTVNVHIDPNMQKLIATNQGQLGVYFQSLLTKNIGKREESVLALLARSTAYRENNLPKLLELVNDIKAVHQAKIDFVTKYLDELFLPKAVEIEREEIEFLNTRILPYLSHFV